MPDTDPRSRARREHSLATVVAGILDDTQVPMPNEVVRVVAAERRGKAVSAEQLARMAAYERENYLRTRMPPLLCSVIDRRGLALKPRTWARGDWRLARRIYTPDVHDHWQAGVARELCREVSLRFPPATERLQQVALEAVARVIGPVAAYMPGSQEQWEELRHRVMVEAPDPDPEGLTAEQMETEMTLQEHPEIAPVNLYFGLDVSAIIAAPPSAPSKLRLPTEGENGEPFDRVVRRRLSGDEGKARELLAYLQGWSFVRDEQAGRVPTSSEFADFWKFDAASVRRDEALFAEAFPEEENPERIVRLLEEGLPRAGQLAWLMGIEVIDSADHLQVHAPAPGQRWQGRDGSVLTISEVDGSAIIGHLSQHGTTSIWAAGRDKLLADFNLELPTELWLVTFDLNAVPHDLFELLHRGGLALVNFRRPSDPRPDSPGLRGGTVRAQVVARNEDAARVKVVSAFAGREEIRVQQIHVRALGMAENA